MSMSNNQFGNDLSRSHTSIKCSSRPQTGINNNVKFTKMKSENIFKKINLDEVDMKDPKYLSKNMKKFLEIKKDRETRNTNIQC